MGYSHNISLSRSPSYFSSLKSWFWSTDFWLPEGYDSWEDLRVISPEGDFTNPDDILLYPIVACFVILFFTEYFLPVIVMAPIADIIGVKKSESTPVEDNPTLQKLFKKYNTKIPEKVLLEVANEVGFSLRQVQRWLERRAVQDEVGLREKFILVGCQTIFYFCLTVVGLYVILRKPFTYDTKLIYENYPKYASDFEIWVFNVFCFGYAWSRVIHMFFEPLKKVTMIMIVHHVATLTTTYVTFSLNLQSLLCLSNIYFYSTEVTLNLSKIFNYLNFEKTKKTFSIIFLANWFIARLYLYGVVLGLSVINSLSNFYGYCGASLFFMIIFNSLSALNIYWTIVILQGAWKTFYIGNKKPADSVSDCGEFSNEEKSHKEKKIN